MSEQFESMVDNLLRTCQCGETFDRHEGCEDDLCNVNSAVLRDSDVEWRICTRCKGDGELRGYPGVYTQEDFETTDDIEDYLNHRRTCEDCGGSGKVREISDVALERPEVAGWLRDFYDMRTIEAAERAAGA